MKFEYRILKIHKPTNYCIGYLPKREHGDLWLPLGLPEEQYAVVTKSEAQRFIAGMKGRDPDHLYVMQWVGDSSNDHKGDI